LVISNTQKKKMSNGQTLSSINFGNAQKINNEYFTSLSNGGLGNVPNPVNDDSITTDQVVMRRQQRPPILESTKLRFDPNVQGNPYYIADQNRMTTTSEKLSELALRGITVLGTDEFGQYNKMIIDPNNMAVYNSYARESESDSMSVILWILIGVGVIVLLGRSTSRYVTV